MPTDVLSEVGRSGSTSLSLIERVQSRDPAAWRRLAGVYGPIVYQWAIAFGLQASDAADVTQEVFAAVAGHVADFRKDGVADSFRGWLYAITRNKVRDHFRRRADQPQAIGGETAQWQLEQIPNLPDVLENSPAGTAADLARRVLALIQTEFEPQTWQAFWQTTVASRPPADVAAELGLSLASVYQAKSRVLKYLRRELDGLGP
ncbi:MAG: sigma-70 family RNA polymerase sigma factor [Pirellulaceae bacterium]|nr:sigma-70 family RNA polymerase sigma factor [Pirellulaceae bacterium]